MLKKLKYLGPGLLYAGAAIGVSHLVQSTRAGAQFGLTMIFVVIAANLLKYPFFLMGPLYAAHKGKSILSGYKELGNWALICFQLLTVSTMFAVIAAITVVTAGLAEQIFQLNISPRFWSVMLLASSLIFLIFGKYRLLDKVMKWVIGILSLTVVAAFIISLFITKEVTTELPTFDWQNPGHIFFLIAFVGWMPAPMDISIWHSVWTVQKQRLTGKKPLLKQVYLDFNVGFIGTAILAICFLALGTKVFYGGSEELSAGGVAFSGQLIGLYSSFIGGWSFYLIAAAAFTTMLSTCITCLDAFPRVTAEAAVLMQHGEENEAKEQKLYIWMLLLLVMGAMVILFYFLQNMKQMVDFATTISFLTTPLLASINFLAFERLRKEGLVHWKIWQWILIITGFVFLYGFAIYYLFQRVIPH